MTSLAALSSELLTALQLHPICMSAGVFETKEFSADQFYLKIRADFQKESHFQIRVYYNQGHIDYAYQLFGERPLLRWDNKEEFAHLSTYPHHYHDSEGGVHPSSLAGEPLQDIHRVLQQVSDFLEKME